MSFSVRVFITLKDAVLDPQGDATKHALSTLGFDNLENVRFGKVIHMTFKEAVDPEHAKEQATLMAQKLLCNLVMENYQIEVSETMERSL